MKLGSGTYFGKTLDCTTISGLVLTEKIHLSEEVLPEHFHENAYFCLALNGGWSEKVEGKSFHCNPNNVVYHPKEEIHQTSFDKHQHSKTFNVEITPTWLDKVSAYDIAPLEKRMISKDHSLYTYLNKIHREFYRNDQLSALAIESHFMELFIALSRNGIQQQEERTSWLKEVQEVLNTSYLSPLSLIELAKMFGVHPVYLSKSFKKVYSITITDYYRKCRIERACQLLKDTKLSLVDIALECGFYDQSHFCKYFQLSVGQSPSVYRKNPLDSKP